MTPRPFYRWKSFWLGLGYVAFWGWAWWDNTHTRTYFDFRLQGGSDDPVGSLYKSEAAQYREAFFCCLVLWSAWLFWHWKREQRKRTT